MELDRLIVNGHALQGGEFVPLDIAVRDGKVAALGAPGTLHGAHARETLDARGRYVLPGAIDSHFHARAPSHPEREDFASATQAAAAGGVTAIIEMPISIPPTINGGTLRARAELARRQAYVDIGFYSSSATLRREDLVTARDAGALAYKAFLQHVPEGREDEFAGLCLPSTGELLEAFQLLRGTDLPCVFHPEDESMLRRLEEQLRAAGRRDGPAHADSRPDYVEAVSVGMLLRLSERFGVHVHVPHVSSRMTVEVIRDAKRRGVRVTAETCPHYLQFDASITGRLGPYAKCNPPLKAQEDRDALWQAVRDGTIDTIGSDHSPFTRAEKEAGWDNIWAAPPGFPAVEALVPFVVGAALEGRLALPRAAALLYEAPARIFGLWPRKGAIRPGADADLVLYDPAVRRVFDHRRFRSKSRESARLWDGIPATGAVITVLLRGNVVYADDDVVGPPGSAVLERTPAGAGTVS